MQTNNPNLWPVKSRGGLPTPVVSIDRLYQTRSQKDKNHMKNLKNILAVVSCVALLAVASFAQQQGPQTLSTTTLSNALANVNGGAAAPTGVCLASITNVTATVAVQTTLWVDTEAMDVVTNTVPASGTCLTVTRGTHGTKLEGHASGQTVYVGRPNLYQGYDVAGTCWTNAAGTAVVPAILPWINLTDGYRYDCKADGNWFRSGIGSQYSAAVTAAPGFCTGTVGSAETEFLNGAACSGATTATYRYTVATAGELANLRVFSSAAVTGGASKDVLTVMKNGAATTITCTIAAAGTACSDTADGVTVAVGDVITFRFVTATSDTAANVSASVGLYGI